VPRREGEDLVEQHRQRLLTRRLLGIIGVLAATLLFIAARRWWP
jgi:hypothetical protein